MMHITRDRWNRWSDEEHERWREWFEARGVSLNDMAEFVAGLGGVSVRLFHRDINGKLHTVAGCGGWNVNSRDICDRWEFIRDVAA